MSESKSDQRYLLEPESAGQPDRRDEAAAIIDQMIAEGLIDANTAQVIEFVDGRILCVPDEPTA